MSTKELVSIMWGTIDMQKYYVKLGLKENDVFYLVPLPHFELKEGLSKMKL